MADVIRCNRHDEKVDFTHSISGDFHDLQLMTAIIICESFNNNFIDDNIVLKLGSDRTHEPICSESTGVLAIVNILMRSLDVSQ